MSVVLPWLLLAALLTLAGAHVAIVAGLRRTDGWGRALAALFVPPLAPAWAWLTPGLRPRAWVWLGALAAYALGVAVA